MFAGISECKNTTKWSRCFNLIVIGIDYEIQYRQMQNTNRY